MANGASQARLEAILLNRRLIDYKKACGLSRRPFFLAVIDNRIQASLMSVGLAAAGDVKKSSYKCVSIARLWCQLPKPIKLGSYNFYRCSVLCLSLNTSVS
jgi:hypothetical protein